MKKRKLPEQSELDKIVKHYLARYVHIGCGGQPVQMPQHRLIRCSLCSYSSAWEGNLGDAVTEAMGGPRRDTPAFRNMIVP